VAVLLGVRVVGGLLLVGVVDVLLGVRVVDGLLLVDVVDVLLVLRLVDMKAVEVSEGTRLQALATRQVRLVTEGILNGDEWFD